VHVGLDAEQIVDTALELMDLHGVEWLSMRRLAQHLGVSPPTLYWHVRSKEALWRMVAQRVLSGLEFPSPQEASWEARVRHLMTSVRGQLLDHPSVLELLGRVLPEAVDRMTAEALDILTSAGFEGAEADRYVRIMTWLVFGFSFMEAELESGATDTDGQYAAMIELFVNGLEAARVAPR